LVLDLSRVLVGASLTVANAGERQSSSVQRPQIHLKNPIAVDIMNELEGRRKYLEHLVALAAKALAIHVGRCGTEPGRPSPHAHPGGFRRRVLAASVRSPEAGIPLDDI
jgi:hypothetical protein